MVETEKGKTNSSRKLDQQRQNRDKYSAFTKINFRRGDVVLFSTRILHALYPLFDTPKKPKQKSVIAYKTLRSQSTARADRPSYSPLKLLGILLIEGYSVQNSELLENAIKNAKASKAFTNNKLLEYIATVYNLRLYNTIVDHSVATNQAIIKASGRAMGLNRSLDKISNVEAKKAVIRHNLIHAFYEKYSQQIDAVAGSNAEEIHTKFLKHLRHHDSRIKLKNERIKSNLRILAEEHPELSEPKPKHQKNWRGVAKYLPLIQNERIYLFYKKIASYFEKDH